MSVYIRTSISIDLLIHGSVCLSIYPSVCPACCVSVSLSLCLSHPSIIVYFSNRTLSEEKPHVMLNQFPCESLITVKDCLAAVARRVAGGSSPAWLPETFNLQTELPQFIKNYQQRQKWYFSYESSPCILEVSYYSGFLQEIITPFFF